MEDDGSYKIFKDIQANDTLSVEEFIAKNRIDFYIDSNGNSLVSIAGTLFNN
jgi:hypothetical protein